jgi:curved DNA-binding protein CbpA
VDGGDTAWAMLDLQPGATRAQIEKAFKAKALKVHPDQGGDNALFRALIKARDACLAEAED